MCPASEVVGLKFSDGRVCENISFTAINSQLNHKSKNSLKSEIRLYLEVFITARYLWIKAFMFALFAQQIFYNFYSLPTKKNTICFYWSC